MPTLEWNRNQWDRNYGWQEAGAEWSRSWGSDDLQWYGTLLPRIHCYLPAESILEIAPGYGRWTAFLQSFCRSLYVVDYSASCIAHCRRRFSELEHIDYAVNDGMHLDSIGDSSIDFAFSFDSLVHVEDEVIASYLRELARVLKRDGVAFLHHSNLGEFRSYFRMIKAIKGHLRPAADAPGSDAPAAPDPSASTSDQAPLIGWLTRMRKWLRIDSDHSRALSMSAQRFDALAGEAGLKCVSQEKINWGSRRTIDCLSIVARREARWPDGAIISNPRFMQEAAAMKAIAPLYGAPRFQRAAKVSSA